MRKIKSIPPGNVYVSFLFKDTKYYVKNYYVILVKVNIL